MAVKPTAPPAFDAKAANDAWLRRVLKDDGSPYAVFSGGGFHALNRWVLGTGEYDGKGLADAVKTNAVEQNQHIASDNARHEAINQDLNDLDRRVAALEAQRSAPFPGSG